MKVLEDFARIGKAVRDWVGLDGFCHFCLSALIVVAFGWIRPVAGAAVIALAVGAAKELADYLRASALLIPFSFKHSLHDLACDAVGVLAGLVLVFINTI